MKPFLIVGALLTATATQALSESFVISCHRGPTSKVIWDRPNTIFMDSLQSVGYAPAEARQMADTICSNPDLVGDLDGLKAAVLELMELSPPS